MNRSLPRLAFAAAAASASLFSGVVSPAVAADKPDLKAVAERIVGDSARVKAGDRVVVRGDVRDLDLIEQISYAVARRGGETMLLVSREKSGRQYYDEVPAAQDDRSREMARKLVDLQTVDITVSGAEHPGQFKDVPPERIATRSQHMQALLDARLQKGVRMVEVGNGLYPTEATAKRFGLTKAQLEDVYWKGLNADAAKMQATGDALRAILRAGKEVRVTHPNGTDLTFRIENRPVHISTGVIPAGAKGAAVQVWLPAGEVYTTPVKGSAKGKVVFDTIPFDDGELASATYVVEAGKLAKHDAKPGPTLTRWQALYAAAPAGKEEFSAFDIGINPNVKVPAGSKLASWVPAGTVSLVFGGNSWAGGDNKNPWNGGGSINGCTVTVDGKTIVDKGMLKLPGMAAAAQ